MLLPAWFVILAAALFGAAVGSFLNVCIWRLPREGMTISSPRRSHCTSCGFTIPWRDNLPILSWLLLGGSCRSCRAPISPRYFLIEGLTAMAFSILADRYLLGPEPRPLVFATLLWITGSAIVVAAIDQDLQIIPDEITLPGMMAVPALAILIPDFHLPGSRPVAAFVELLGKALSSLMPAPPETLAGPLLVPAVLIVSVLCACLGFLAYRAYWRIAHGGETRKLRDCLLPMILSGSAGGVLTAMALRPEWTFHPRTIGFWSALAGMGTGAGTVLAVGLIGRQVFRKEAMGFGDVKLMGFLGGFSGWAGVLAGFGLACFLGTAVGIYRLLRYRSHYLPFGPYLVAGSLVMIVWPDAFYAALLWYMGLF